MLWASNWRISVLPFLLWLASVILGILGGSSHPDTLPDPSLLYPLLAVLATNFVGTCMCRTLVFDFRFPSLFLPSPHSQLYLKDSMLMDSIIVLISYRIISTQRQMQSFLSPMSTPIPKRMIDMEHPLSKVVVIVIESGQLFPVSCIFHASSSAHCFVSICVLGMSDRSYGLASQMSRGIILDYPLCASSY